MLRLLMIGLLLSFHTLYGGDRRLYFNISMEQGLTDASVTSIVQDPYGFIWIGTVNGLNRFDAYHIKRYYANATNGLLSNYISSLYTDSKGTLWVGSNKGLMVFDFHKNRFLKIESPVFENNSTVYCYEEDRVGNMYVGTASGLYFWKRAENTWINLSEQYCNAGDIALVKGLLLHNDERTLLVSTAKKGFYKVDLSTQTIQTLHFKLGVFDECCLYTNKLLPLNDSLVLCGSLSLGMLKLNLNTNTFSWPVKGGALNGNAHMMYNTVPEIVKDRSGHFWIASHYHGLCRYFPDQDSTGIYAVQPPGQFNFNARSIQALYEDRQGNLWVGTNGSGIYRFIPTLRSVSYFRQNDKDKSALPALGNVVAISAIDTSTLLIGMKNGMSLFDKKTDFFTHMPGNTHYKENKILEYATCAVKKGDDLWIGTSRLGFMRYNLATGALKILTRFSAPQPVYADGVTKILDLGNDRLCLLNFNTITLFNTRTFANTSIANDTVSPLYRLTDIADIYLGTTLNELWIFCADGSMYLYRFDIGTLTDRTPAFGGLTRAPIIYKAVVDQQRQVLWCATNYGVMLIENDQVKKIYTIHGQKDEYAEIRNLLLTGNYLWITNGRAVARIDLNSDEQLILGQQEGFIDLKLYPHSFIRSPWNTLLIGSNDGFFEIFPEQLDKTAALPAFLTSFSVHGKPYQNNSSIFLMDTIQLSYKQNFFSFDVSSFDYASAGDIEYAYMLEGFDKEWNILPKGQRSGSYTNVPGGTYRLKLISRCGNGEWNSSGKDTVLIISKPYYQQTWFLLLLGLLTSAFLYILYKRRIYVIKQKEKRRRDYEIRLNELENSALRTQMNPHFIFNSLNTINALINAQQNDRANKYLGKFSRLIRLILDYSRAKRITLQEELELVALYIELEQLRFSHKFDYKLNLPKDISADLLEIPPMIVQPFVENAILHGLLPLQDAGLLEINISVSEQLLEITVRDNGMGREQSAKNRQHSYPGHKSHGTDITIKRIELFNQEHGCDSGVRILDMKSDTGQATGTKVVIYLARSERF